MFNFVLGTMLRLVRRKPKPLQLTGDYDFSQPATNPSPKEARESFLEAIKAESIPIKKPGPSLYTHIWSDQVSFRFDKKSAYTEAQDNHVVLENIKSDETKQGYGTSFIRRVIELADIFNVEVHVLPAGSFPLTSEELSKWYKKLGFEELKPEKCPVYNRDYLTYKPISKKSFG